MTEKVTTMILNVDLQCCDCYKKIKKILCKFPQIRNQVYDEKENTVTITVICCNPEKIRDNLCCKGGKTIKSVKIKQDKPELVVTAHPFGVYCGPCSEGYSGGPCYHGFGRPPPPPPPPCYCYGYGRPCYMTPCDCYTEGSSSCRVM